MSPSKRGLIKVGHLKVELFSCDRLLVRMGHDGDLDDYESLPSGSVVTHMIAGAIAGTAEHCVMYPLDSVKVRQLE